MKTYLFGKHRKKHSNSIPTIQAEKELSRGWGYIIHNGEIIGMGKGD